MTNAHCLPLSKSVVEAWIKACSYLATNGRQTHNLLYEITDPSVLDKNDENILINFDNFARQADIGSVTTVANTIFPLDFYLKYGSAELLDTYHTNIYSRVKKNWGNYFDRLTRRRDTKGKLVSDKDGDTLNPLKSVIEKLKRRIDNGNGTFNHYEMSISDEAYELATYVPERDSNYYRGGPCLSHISIKIDKDGKLNLTAIYRSHYYVERALGNLVGLARLQAYIANECGATVGSLVIHAVSATLESKLDSASSTEVSSFLTSSGIK